MGARRTRRRGDAYDVAVIGGGAAGLAAAAALVRAGADVLLLEARDRLGGRVDTRREAGWPLPLEAGAEFMHGRDPALERLWRRAGARRRAFASSHLQGPEAGGPRRANAAWQEAQRLLANIAPGPTGDRSFAAELNEPRWRRADRRAVQMALGFVEGFNAADAARIGVRALIRQADAEDDIDGERLYRFPDGYDAVLAPLARDVRRGGGEIRLATPVRAVRWSGGGARGSGRGGATLRLAPLDGLAPATGDEVRARRVLVTVPTALLRGPGAVRFDPALPAAQRHALGLLALGNVVKVLLRLRGGTLAQHGWAAGDTFLHVDRGVFPTFWRVYGGRGAGGGGRGRGGHGGTGGDSDVVVAWAAGPAAGRLPEGTPARLRAALASLARGLGAASRDLARAAEAWRVYDWSEDRWARGAYSYALVGGGDAPAELATPAGDALFFAGEAADGGGHPGTVHGALASGARAAKLIAGRG